MTIIVSVKNKLLRKYIKEKIMKIVVTGTRGIPDILGGVETHSQELFPRIVDRGHDVTVIRRKSYITEQNKIKEYKGVKLIDLYAPRKKSLEAIVHTFLAVIKARKLKANVIHIHAIGPALLSPLAKLLGLKVVITHHGPDYNRKKWGKFAKFALRLGERLGAKYADKIIVISQEIKNTLEMKYGRNDTWLIFNGVSEAKKSVNTEWLRTWGIDNKPYIMTAGRFVKEKGFDDLIEGYLKSGISDKYKLVIAGDADHEDEYSLALKEKAKEAGVILTGFIKGEPLYQLLTNTSLFVLPSYHEGLPISLLEAMSYGTDVLVSNIPANQLPELDKDSDFFQVGNVDDLALALKRKTDNIAGRSFDLSSYNWDAIAIQTEKVYQSLIKTQY